MEWNDMSKGKWNVRSHLSADQYKSSLHYVLRIVKQETPHPMEMIHYTIKKRRMMITWKGETIMHFSWFWFISTWIKIQLYLLFSLNIQTHLLVPVSRSRPRAGPRAARVAAARGAARGALGVQVGGELQQRQLLTAGRRRSKVICV